MRGFRLNGWQRIGIVFAVVWALFAWFYVRWVNMETYDRVYETAYNFCSISNDAKQTDFDWSVCTKKAENAAHDFFARN
jgi:hypothetical protein